LADHFLEEAAKRSNIKKKSLSRAAMDSLLAYSWPGNIRELANIIERASLLSNSTLIQRNDLPISGAETLANPTAPDSLEREWLGKGASLNETLEAVEKELIVQALRKSRGKQVEAAKLLGLKNKNLWLKIRKHNIDPHELKRER